LSYNAGVKYVRTWRQGQMHIVTLAQLNIEYDT